MKSKMLFLSFIAFWLFTYDALGQDRFLTYPLEQSINAIIRSGWYYDDYYEGEVLHSCELHLPSGAIDYDENVIGGQASFKIIAACEGIVVISGWSDSYGWRVVLKHTLSNGHIYFTAYTHLNEEPYLNEGDVVLRNQFIGNAGTTGNSSGVHLHFEVRHYEGQTPEQATWATSSAVDPYDKYRRADGYACGGGEDTTPYPSPTNGVSGRMGSSYLWTTDVPSYSNINYSGHYSDGWHSNGTSQAILTVYDQNSTNIGFPFDNGGTPYVHFWYDPNWTPVEGVWIQDYLQPNENLWFSGSNDGQSAIILNTDFDPDQAFLVKGPIWGAYKIASGFRNVGPPEANQETVDGLIKQRFKYCVLVYNGSQVSVESKVYVSTVPTDQEPTESIPVHQVQITTSPSTSEIWANGVWLGTSDLYVNLYEGFTYQMTAKHEGYDDTDFTFTVGTSNTSVYVTLPEETPNVPPLQPDNFPLTLEGESGFTSSGGYATDSSYVITSYQYPMMHNNLYFTEYGWYEFKVTAKKSASIGNHTYMKLTISGSNIGCQEVTSTDFVEYYYYRQINNNYLPFEICLDQASDPNQNNYLEVDKVVISLTNEPPPTEDPVLALSETSLAFGETSADTLSDSFTVANTGTGSLNGDIVIHGHAQVLPSAFSLIEDADVTCSVKVDAINLSPGAYTDSLVFTTNDVPDTVLVSYTVLPHDTMTVIATCDNRFQLWINGVSQDSMRTDWWTAHTYEAPVIQGENVVAVKGKDDEGIASFIAHITTTNNNTYVSNASWKVSTTLQSNWTAVNFDDSNWSNATSVGVYGISPWNQGASGFPANSTAHWIWSDESCDDDSVYLRFTFTDTASAAPTDYTDSPNNLFTNGKANDPTFINDYPGINGWYRTPSDKVTFTDDALWGDYSLQVANAEVQSNNDAVRFSQTVSVDSGVTYDVTALLYNNSGITGTAYVTNYQYYGCWCWQNLWWQGSMQAGRQVISTSFTPTVTGNLVIEFRFGHVAGITRVDSLILKEQGLQKKLANQLVGVVLPKEYSIANYPNPFNPQTMIKYSLPEAAQVKLEIYNLLGQQVITLVDAKQEAGWYEFFWNAANNPSGIYLYRFQANRFTKTGRMLLVK